MIEQVKVIITDPGDQLLTKEVNLPFNQFLKILEPYVRNIAAKTATDVIRDQKDCG